MEKETTPPTFKSLTPRDPEFHKYLMGDFSSNYRAIPQASLNLQNLNEIVTFEIRAVDHLKPASPLVKSWTLLKPATWLTVLVPLMMISNLQKGPTAGVTVLLALVLLLLMTFANWKADLADHIEGWDRLQGGHETSLFKNGWFTGTQIQKWSYGVLGSAALLGIPLLLKQPWVLVPYALAITALLVVLPRWWRKSIWPGVSSFCIFLLTGPLLTVGIDLVFDGEFSRASVALGMSWGLWMSYVRQQKIYTKQWFLHHKQPTFFFLGLGFDRSKAWMRLMILVVPIFMLFHFLFVPGGAAWFFPLLVIHALFVFLELQLNEKVQTSIGSTLRDLQRLFHWHHWVTALIMVMGSIVWKNTF